MYYLISCQERIEKALLSKARNDNRVMSIIIDGMDQSNLKIPHLGSQNSFPRALKSVSGCIFDLHVYVLTISVVYRVSQV